MKDQEIRAAILEEAYDFMKQKGMRAVFPLFERTKDWGVEEKDINRNVDYLVQKGLVKKEGVKLVGGLFSPVIRITAEGVDEYEREHGHGDYGKHGCLPH